MRKLADSVLVRSEVAIRRHPRLHYVVKRELDRIPLLRERLRRRVIQAAVQPHAEYGSGALSVRGREILSLLLQTQHANTEHSSDIAAEVSE